MGRNQSVSAAGNVAMALLLGLVGHLLGRSAIFVLVAGLSVATIASVLRIAEADIDHDAARGADNPTAAGGRSAPGRVTAVLGDRALLTFGLCAVLFHFANASLLTLVGQRFAERSSASLYLSATLVVTQLVVIPTGIIVGRAAHHRPRRGVLLVAFAVLPVRCLAYGLSAVPLSLVSIGVLDGIAAGTFAVMQVIVVADLTRGTGHFNLALGAIATAVGIGASSSNLVAGLVVRQAGFAAAFGTMGIIAVAALALYAFAMPETGTAPLPTATPRPALVAVA